MMKRQAAFLLLLSVLYASKCAVLTTEEAPNSDTTLKHGLQTTTEVFSTSKQLHKTNTMTSDIATMTTKSMASSEATTQPKVIYRDPPCTGLFELPNYSADIMENRAYTFIRFSQNLTLCHPELNEKLSVQVLTDGIPKDKFWLSAVDNRTYHLKMDGSVDYEQHDRIELFLKSNSGAAVVTLRIQDENDNPPVLHVLDKWKNVTVKENSPVGTMVAMVHATDADTGQNAELTYNIDGDKGVCPAAVDSTSGELTLKEKLDYETTKMYRCFVYAEGKLALYKSNFVVITINVMDENDNAPICTESMNQFVMSWPLHNGDYVGKVTAYDRDSNKNGEVEYSIESPFNTIVQINSSAGEITVIDGQAYQFGEARNVTFLTTAKDGGTPPLQGQCQVMITLIKGYQRWFYDQESYIFKVREDAKLDDEVGEVNVNSSDVIHYRIKSVDDTLPFHISDNGIITVQGGLDYETTQSYFIVVEAHDKYAYVSVNVTINLIDVNDNRPNFTNPSKNKFIVPISRLTASETIVFSVKAVDKDSGENGDVWYFIKDNMDGALFGIERITGNIRLRKSAANMMKQVLHITVEATDNGPVKYTRFKEIDFIITNETYSEYYYTSVTEYASHNGGKIDVKTDDLMGVFKHISKDMSVEIISGNDDNMFSLSSTHELKSVGRLDYEVKPYHELTLNVTGKASGLPVGIIHVAIEVIDINDNVPMFLQPGSTKFDIPTTAAAHAPIYQFAAHDKDSPENGDDVLMYTLTSPGDIVDLDPKTGMVTLKHPVNLSDSPFTVQARVNDTINQSATLKIAFTVFDPKSNAPVFEKPAYFGSVSENKPPNSEVMRAIPSLPYLLQTAHDVTLDIVGTDKPFYATPMFGEVHTNATLDRETKSKYAIAIRSLANHHKTMSTTVFGLINVDDENDNAPEFPFSVRRFYVKRSDRRYFEVAKIKAIDKDSSSHLTYSIRNGPSNIFSVSTHGRIASIYVVDPGLLHSSATLTMQLYVQDEMPSHNDTMEIVVSVL